jgi:methylenetetrahydrofolate reductase (NADPH)
MFYDNNKYFEFVNKCRAIGITVPIIPGLKPLTSLSHKTFLPKFFHIDFPMELATELDKCKTDKEITEVGVEWGVHQAKELIEKGAPVLHFYTMGKGTAVKRIAKEIF